MKKKKKVLVGLSGGVDSSVAACLLKEQGYDVIGVHLQFWADPKVSARNKCCSYDGLSNSLKIANHLRIPFHVINLEKDFKNKVVDYFIDSYKSGITPNPCIECNRNIKFGIFIEKMEELGADYVATGHYVRKKTITHKAKRSAPGSNANNEIYELFAAKDKVKDQSYFLYTLNQEKLRHIIFPIGEYEKSEVRALAKKFGIDEINNQKESQNICFFPEKTPENFLRRYLQKSAFKKGPIVTVDGDKIGEHDGLLSYTIGQRKGLGIGGIKGCEDKEGQPWYVVRVNKVKNVLVVGQNEDLFYPGLEAKNLTFVNGEQPEKEIEIEAKIRSRFPGQKAGLSINKGKGVVKFRRPQRAITPGQSVVFYEGEKVLGGGVVI